MTPTMAHGKICYIEIPATDVQRSADFYRTIFGWHVSKRGDGTLSFIDSVHQVSGAWVLGRAPATEPTLVISIMVADLAKTVQAITAHGGEIVQPAEPGASEVFATFRDPAGNLLGIYQESSLARG